MAFLAGVLAKIGLRHKNERGQGSEFVENMLPEGQLRRFFLIVKGDS